MVQSKGRCKVCGHTVAVGSSDTPMDIAAEGVMEAIQDHIFRDHCDDDFTLVEGDYAGVAQAWEYI